MVAVVRAMTWTRGSPGPVYAWSRMAAAAGASSDPAPTGGLDMHVRRIDGSEGFSGTGDTLELGLISGASHSLMDQVWSYAFVLKAVAEGEAGPHGWDGSVMWDGVLTTAATETQDPTAAWGDQWSSGDPAYWVHIVCRGRPSAAPSATVTWRSSATTRPACPQAPRPTS